MAGLGLGLGPPASASHGGTVTAVDGDAFGYWSDEISLFGGPQNDIGPTPTISLLPDASNSPVGTSAATALVSYGPARLLTADTITLNSSGSLGTAGSVTSTSDVQNINYAATQPTNTGSEVFGYPPPEVDPQFINFNPDNLHTSVAGTATATPSGVSGSTTITNGMLRTDAQSSTDCTAPIDVNPCGRAGEAHTHDLTNPEGVVTIPTNPAPNYTVAGHLHLGSTTTDYFVVVFNEQVINPDGSITVNPVHEYFGYKLVNGVITQDLSYGAGGSILHGHLYIGQVHAGLTSTPLPHDPPLAVDDAYGTDYQTPLTVPAPGVLGNDSDPENAPLTASNASDPAGGSVSLNADGSFTYTPDAGFSGLDSFTYTVSDDHGSTDTGTVTIDVGGPPQANAGVSVSGAPDPVDTRGVITWTITVTNAGPDTATGVSVRTRFSGTRYIDGSGAGCTVVRGKNRGTVCPVADIPPGESAFFTLQSTAGNRPGTASATSFLSTSLLDPDQTDNTFTDTVSVQRV